MPTVRLDLEYDGTRFAGWARQPGLRTVEGALMDGFARLGRGEVALVVAGRTDSGVHASGQVCSYRGALVSPPGLNAVLPPDVAVTAATVVPDGFDARRHAIARSYRYRVLTRPARPALLAGRVLHHPRALDRAALDACAAAIVGRHDFTAFTPAETLHRHFTRTVTRAAWVDEAPDLLAFTIEADAFLRHMNRVLVGTMLEVARGRRTVVSFTALLAGAPRSAAGPTAPAAGLELTGVRYPAAVGDGGPLSAG